MDTPLAAICLTRSYSSATTIGAKPIGGRPVHVTAGDVNVTAGRTELPARDLQRRRLPCAVRAEQRNDAVFRNNEIDAVQHFDAPVGCLHVAELEDRRAHAASPSEPRYAAWTALFFWISFGVPTAISLPKSSTWILVHKLITNSMSCSTSKTARPAADNLRSS